MPKEIAAAGPLAAAPVTGEAQGASPAATDHAAPEPAEPDQQPGALIPAVPPVAVALAPTREEALAHLARILESREFRTARNRARFLEYVVTRTLDGAEDGLKEYTIGVEVFERGEGFDPRTDGVVRTQAGLVRKHLERYYATEGRGEPIEIDLPKGHYIPQLRRRVDLGAGGPLSAVPGDIGPATIERRIVRSLGPRAPMATGTWLRPALMVAAALAIVATALIASGTGGKLLGRTSGQPAEATAAGPGGGAAGAGGAANVAAIADAQVLAPVWGPFFARGASNVLAFGIPQFFTGGGGLWIRDVTVNSSNTPTNTPGLSVVRRHLGALQPAEAYTGIGEAYGVYLVSRFFMGRSHELRVMRSPTVSWDNLKHDNVIFLTSARFKTLAAQLSFPPEFQHVLGSPNRVANLHPLPGEDAEYIATGDNSPISVDHAIVSMVPGKLPGRRVLILSGGGTWGTQAAAEYVTEPGYLRELNQHLKECQEQHGLARHPEFFQVLLRVEVRDNQPLGARYVTHHDLAITETGEPLATPPVATAQRR